MLILISEPANEESPEGQAFGGFLCCKFSVAAIKKALNPEPFILSCRTRQSAVSRGSSRDLAAALRRREAVSVLASTLKMLKVSSIS